MGQVDDGENLFATHAGENRLSPATVQTTPDAVFVNCAAPWLI
jgi:hypothetical protein